MGLLNSLIESADRFKDDLLPVGYAERKISWVINIDPAGKHPPQVHKQKPKRAISAPATPSDRTSGKVSPTLLVDKVGYAIGKPVDAESKVAYRQHRSFRALLRLSSWNEPQHQARHILDALKHSYPLLPDAKAGDLVAFEIGSQPRATDKLTIQKFWSDYMSNRLGENEQHCVVCGRPKPIARILPFKLNLMNYSVQLSSFNSNSFCSSGSTTDSGNNAALCYICAGTATQVFQHLLKRDKDDKEKETSSGRHSVVLTYDDSPNRTQPLRNQIAVFWTKEFVELQTRDGLAPGEELPRLAMEDTGQLPEDKMPAHAEQLRDLLMRPFAGGVSKTELPSNRFYLAVLSPNKSRLVIRDWLEQDVDKMRQCLKRYFDALQILHPAGRYVGFPPLPAMLATLQSPVSRKKKSEEKPRLPQVEPDLTRKLLRCMFAGAPPPAALLTRAVRCFRVPDPPAEGEQRRRQQFRKMSLTAAIKLVLTYDKPQEQRAMEERHTKHDDQSDYKRQSPYLSGCLLAVLEAIQARPGQKVNTTLVDRFYGAASTAPATVFGNLVSTATKAHLPKLRKENKEWFTLRSGEGVNINNRIAETCAAINDAGGFKPYLTSEEQGQFALGFYAERAELKPPPKPNIGKNSGNSENDKDVPNGDQE